MPVNALRCLCAGGATGYGREMVQPAQIRSSGQGPLAPVIATLIAIALFATMDALMKRASIAAGVYTALLARNLIGTAALAPAWRLSGGRWPARATLRIHALRSLLVTGMALSFFWGLVRTPMAEAMALSFISPLIALYLAAVFLKEQIKRQAILASLCGLGGVLIIVAARIGGRETDAEAAWGIAAILASAVFYAGNLILQRLQAQVAGPLEVALFQNGCVALFLLPGLPFFWATPQPAALMDIAGSAALASASLMLLAWAYARAEAQKLVPIEYTAFIWSALMGWLWFGERVTAATIGGVALILAGVWIGTRKDRVVQPPPA